MYLRRFVLLVMGLLVIAFAQAQALPLDTAVHRGILPNGFTYFIRHNDQPKGRVFLYLVNKIGSLQETDEQKGLAHFMEHMNFNGTTHFPKNQLVDYLQKTGVRFGADLNAYTSFDETVYQLPIPSDNAEVLSNGFLIMRDWAQEATLDSVEIDKERGVILEEERLGRGANERMQRQYFPLLLNHSRYAERIPIGKVDILKTFQPPVIRSFYKDWYRPDQQALVVVGDIDPVAAEAIIKKLFSDLKNPTGEKPRVKYEVPLTGSNQFISITDKEMPVIDMQVLVKHKNRQLVTQADYMEVMKRQLFNAVVAERISQLSQTPNLPFIGADVRINGFIGGLDAFTVNVILKQAKMKEGFELVWSEIGKIKTSGFTGAELERAKKNYLSGMETGYRERDKTSSANYVEEYKRLFLENEASPGIAWEYAFVRDHIGQVSLDQMNAFTKEYIRDQDRSILLLAPEKIKSELPDSATVNSWLLAAESAGSTQEAAATRIDEPLLKNKPAPGRITTTGSMGGSITEWRLSNGVRVLLKPTPFKNDEIRFAGFAPGGTSVYPDADYINAAHALMIADFGLNDLNPVMLQQKMTGKIASADPFISDRWQGVEGASTNRDLETAMQLIYLRFTAPRKDTVLFNNFMNSASEMIANRYSDPSNVFTDTINYVLGNYNIRRKPLTESDLKRIDLEKLYDIYRQRFEDASAFTFVFVGSFNTDSLKPLVEQYLGALPSLQKKETVPDLGITIPSGKLDKKIFKGSENKATVRIVYSGAYSYSPENNVLLSALKEVLQIKIIQHLREDKSEVYSPKVQFSGFKYPHGHYLLSMYFGCAPSNAAGLMDAVDQEVAILREKGPDPEDLQKFKAEYKRMREINLSDNEYILNVLVDRCENGEDPASFITDPKIAEGLTPAALKKAARRYLDGKNVIRFELLPEQQSLNK